MASVSTSGQGFEQLVSKNRLGIRSLEATYLQNQYEKMQESKNAEKYAEKMQKQHELQMLNKLNTNYLNEISDNRQKKLRQMRALSMEYEDFIKNRQNKGRVDRYVEKNLERSTLEAPTWVRDVFTERDTYKKNMQHYSKALNDHVKMRELRRQAEKQEQLYRKRKIDQEAEAILRKQRQELQARHRQKSLFEKRQNELLGVKSQYPHEIGALGMSPQQTILKRRQQDLYSKGLQIQLKKEQQKRYTSQDKMSLSNSNVYNPITNPLPFIYKNPNVLRMMAKN